MGKGSTGVQAVLALGLMMAMLAGCAGYHSMPPQDYSARSAASPTVLKLVFDQYGEPYPDSTGPVALPPQQPNKNIAFGISAYYRKAGQPYDPGAILDAKASAVVRQMQANRSQRLVILIKGFNNSYESSDAEFAFVRQRIADFEPAARLTFLQVYWDSIAKGPGTAPAPLAYFADSLVSSNLAGMCGLRALLMRLPPGTDVTLLTHSRGAAVALSAAHDPMFDENRKNPIVKCEPPPPRPLHLGDVRAVMFAPAVGDGHMRRFIDDRTSAPETGFHDVIDRVYVGHDPNDEATAKKHFGIRLGGRRFGDTRLNSSNAYFEEVAQGSGGRLQRESFTQSDHGWPSYMANDRATRCLFWAGGLLEARPSGCQVTR